MSAPAIRVEGVWKEYRVGSAPRHNTFYDLLTDRLSVPFRKRRSDTRGAETQFYALRDVTFEVERGAVLGVVGRNGAGKSTLLKILSRITAPSRGRATLRGRLASLLEVGTGFHPELTGRENIQLNATILGMRRSEIASKFDRIVAFSGVERFLDTPVKRYSSGMYVRLAFAIAAHVDADILLIDEVLAVGDAEFQKRCLGMMDDVARDGRTVVFVSHNLTAVRNLCSKGLLLNRGTIEALGSMDDVLRCYSSSADRYGAPSVDVDDQNRDSIAALRRVSVVRGAAPAGAPLSVGAPISILARIEIRTPDSEIGVFISCFDSNQVRVFSSGSFFSPDLNGRKLETGHYEFSCSLPAQLLNADDYTLDITLLKDRSEVVLVEPGILQFHVHDDSAGIAGWNWPILGVVRPALSWTSRRLAGTTRIHGGVPDVDDELQGEAKEAVNC
jgi:lipopolysaccharide transport system ATP-binding protein